jgi:hypothetical protein
MQPQRVERQASSKQRQGLERQVSGQQGGPQRQRSKQERQSQEEREPLQAHAKKLPTPGERRSSPKQQQREQQRKADPRQADGPGQQVEQLQEQCTAAPTAGTPPQLSRSGRDAASISLRGCRRASRQSDAAVGGGGCSAALQQAANEMDTAAAVAVAAGPAVSPTSAAAEGGRAGTEVEGAEPPAAAASSEGSFVAGARMGGVASVNAGAAPAAAGASPAAQRRASKPIGVANPGGMLQMQPLMRAKEAAVGMGDAPGRKYALSNPEGTEEPPPKAGCACSIM